MPSSGPLFGGNAVFERLARSGLVWLDTPGIGYYPVHGMPYDRVYFEKYVGYAQTEMGERLNAARLAMVKRHWRGVGSLIDIGIGCGQFIDSRPGTVGYDINPAGVGWLIQRGLFVNPYRSQYDGACFWDSFEHIHNPARILINIRRLVFVALPIFRDLAHVLASKHWRPTEHCWYFTEPGFLLFMAAHGWEAIERNSIESELGREDIMSFAFERVAG